MNVIDTKNWYARVNQMPSTVGPTFTASGTVIVSSSAVHASLIMPPMQDKSLGLRLELVLEEQGIGLTALTEKSVSFSVPGYAHTTHVQIFYRGQELARIDKVEVVS